MKELEGGENISSITALLEKNFPDKKKAIWFRGHSDYSWKLKPTIFRENYDEAGMYEEFIRRFPDHSNSHRNVFEWLTLMQHYGLPTRLLDWTTNLLVALFFCCSKEDDMEKNGAVFAYIPPYNLDTPFSSILGEQYAATRFLEPLVVSYEKDFFYRVLLEKYTDQWFDLDEIEITINGIVLTKNTKTTDIFRKKGFEFSVNGERNHLYSSHRPFRPSHKNSRIKQQQGCFTFHGGKFLDGEEFIPMFSMEERAKSLIKIKIIPDNKKSILKELKLLGITEATLFPEMDYQSKQIKELYKYD